MRAQPRWCCVVRLSAWAVATRAVAGVCSNGGISVSMLRSRIAEIEGGSSVAATLAGAIAQTKSAAIGRAIDIARLKRKVMRVFSWRCGKGLHLAGKPFQCICGRAAIIRHSTTKCVLRSTNGPTQERLNIPLIRSLSQWPGTNGGGRITLSTSAADRHSAAAGFADGAAFFYQHLVAIERHARCLAVRAPRQSPASPRTRLPSPQSRC